MTCLILSPLPAAGADLFLQGVLPPPGGLPDFLAGSDRALAVPGNPIPFAGASACLWCLRLWLAEQPTSFPAQAVL